MNIDHLLQKAINLEFLSKEEGLALYLQAPLADLMFTANQIRQKLVPGNDVTWLIDRNVNITNVCQSCCKFCNFYRTQQSTEAYITTIEQYKQKIDQLYALGGKQLLLQGGMHPKLGLDFYKKLFSDLKSIYPDLKLHALGPAEIVHISKMENLTYKQVLQSLIESGLDSLPGAGAEILVDRVRQIVSPGKCKTDQWLDVMHDAHQLGIITSATMMYGHAEKPEERIEHIIRIREVQEVKPKDAIGFIAFISWPFQDEGTTLQTKYNIENNTTPLDYLRVVAISRILLPNIVNIQASWLTVGKQTGQLALHAGANDFGSIMIEENVVSAAGANNQFHANGIQNAIAEAGFIPKQRNQKYEIL
jgi:cyclic dehypoxanthinyl futalosine synthase